MRAIVVEYAGADDALVRGILEGRALALPPGDGAAGAGDAAAPTDPAHGELSRLAADARQAAAEGEPL